MNIIINERVELNKEETYALVSALQRNLAETQQWVSEQKEDAVCPSQDDVLFWLHAICIALEVKFNINDLEGTLGRLRGRLGFII